MIKSLVISLILAAVITLVVYALILRAGRHSQIKSSHKPVNGPVQEERFTVVHLTQTQLDDLENDLRDLLE